MRAILATPQDEIVMRSVSPSLPDSTRNAELLPKAMAPLCELKRRGIIQRVLCVTWDKSEIDSYLARLPPCLRSMWCACPNPGLRERPIKRRRLSSPQSRSRALMRSEEDALVLKWRPIHRRHGFPSRKIVISMRIRPISSFRCSPASTCRPRLSRQDFDSLADANQPFFYEDAGFMGLKCDVAKLVTPRVAEKLSPLATKTNTHGPFAHVVRYASIFCAEYPMFRRYLRDTSTSPTTWIPQHLITA